jgi:hypothetical protein
MTKNLFQTAKEKTPKKVEKHEIVFLPELESTLSKMAQINEKMAELEAEKGILDSEIRDAGKEAFIKLYNSKKTFPGTLKVKAGEMGFMFITSDKYRMIDKERSNELKKTYGKEIVEEKTSFFFNNEILMKHMNHISELLMSSTKLTDEEKENLLESKVSFEVKKGTIKEAFSILTPKKKNTLDNLVEDIQPIFSIKSVQKD